MDTSIFFQIVWMRLAFMQIELGKMLESGIFQKSDHDYLTARLILAREERIEKKKSTTNKK